MKKVIKYLILGMFCIVQLSCVGQDKPSNEKRLRLEREKAEYYAAKYCKDIMAFRKLLFEQYFQSMDVSQLKTVGNCRRTHPILHPINFKLGIDSVIANSISFSEKILYISVIYFRKTMPESIIWCSNMDNYCTAEKEFFDTYIDPNNIDGDFQIKDGYGVGFEKNKQDGSEIIYLGTDSLLKDYPILLKIYLKKEVLSQ